MATAVSQVSPPGGAAIAVVRLNTPVAASVALEVRVDVSTTIKTSAAEAPVLR